MKFPESSDISDKKRKELQDRLLHLDIHLNHIEEQFRQGGGPGGQKRNKTANQVILTYLPLNLTIRCQKNRKRSINRFIALRELADQVEVKISPQTSNRLKYQEKIKRQKNRRRRRHHNKKGENHAEKI